MTNSAEGGCLCGAVRFRASGDPKWTLWCHCQSCRKHSGAPVSAFVSFDVGKVETTAGEITKFASSPGVLRGFCARCGSTLTCENEKMPGEAHFHLGAFDRPEDFVPTGAFFKEERLAWLHVETVKPA